jgi:D-serine deaminase-like pyridoxal phosphate-dependent protein
MADPEFADLQTPCLLVDLARVRHNLAAMLRHLGGDADRWRPHVKTCKVPEVLDLLLAAGVRQFKCATTKEAAVLLSRARAPIDLLVALAHHGANLQRIAELAAAAPQHRLALLTEDPAHAAEVARNAPLLGLFVDVDPGYRRSGIAMDEPERVVATMRAAGSALRGVQCYEGHLRGDEVSRQDASRAIYRRLRDLLEPMPIADPARFEVVTSGTPTFPFALADDSLGRFRHRVSPGTVVYWDTTSADFGIAGFEFAVTVLTTVISAPSADRITTDAGSKAIDAASGDPCARVLGFDQLRARTPSEEHLPFERVGDLAMPQRGTRLRLVPRHVCPTVNLADEAVLLDGDRLVGIAPVLARGHEVWATVRAGAVG